METLKLLPDKARGELSCTQLLGNPLKGSNTGTRRLFIEQSTFAQEADLKFPIDKSQVSFQNYERGLLLRFNSINQTALLPLPFDRDQSIKLGGGEETVKPARFTTFWILLKLGVPLRIARNFNGTRGSRGPEYIVDPTSVSIESADGSLQLYSSGYDFLSIKEFFGSLVT